MTSLSFGKDCRIRDEREFTDVVKSGKKTVDRDLLIWSKRRAADPEGIVRLGVSVSRKVGGAVRRNRLKRLIRESFRLNRSRFRTGCDLVVYPRVGCPWKTQSEAEAAILNACRKAGVLHKNGEAGR